MPRVLQILDRRGLPIVEIVPRKGDELVLPPGANYRMIEFVENEEDIDG